MSETGRKMLDQVAADVREAMLSEVEGCGGYGLRETVAERTAHVPRSIVDRAMKGAPSDIGRRVAIARAEERGATWQRDALAMHRGEGQPDPVDVCREARAAAVDPYPDGLPQSDAFGSLVGHRWGMAGYCGCESCRERKAADGGPR